MKIYDNELVVSRNESFVYDRFLKNKDGSPYIVSMRLTSPMFRMTITNDNYASEKRYLLNKYLTFINEISDYEVPRFYETRPVRLMSGSGDNDYATNFNSNIPGDAYNPISDQSDVTKYNYAVYYIIDPNSHEAVYKRYIKGEGDITDHWEDYMMRMVIPFGVDITKEWTSKNYTYGIFLMSGDLYIDIMKEYVLDHSDKTQEEVNQMSELELYNEIKSINNSDKAMINDREIIIDRNNENWSPYWIIDYNIPLLNPAKITVKNDPIGGLK